MATEVVRLILELGKVIWAPIPKYYNYNRRAYEDMAILKEKWKALECRKADIESQMEAQLEPGKSLKEEVNNWLRRVEKMNTEIENIKQEADKRMCFSRLKLGKLACEKIQKVEELHQDGDFGDNLVVGPPVTVSHGETLLTPTLVGETTAKRTKEKVWKHLLGEEDSRKIGVYGMGGIGKTTIMKHINNDLLKEKTKFDNVIWVTVSKAINLSKLQEDIACQLNLDLSNVDETTRASKLNKALKNKKRYVLILDDMWEPFSLVDIGISEPTPSNGCKLVLTTRNIEVCRKMDCKVIQMELLSKDESQDLFLDIVGHNVLNDQVIKPIVEDVVKECACLPLAIITIAGSLKKVDDASEWRIALKDLRATIKEPTSVDTPILKRLRFSYDRLKDEKLQRCLLCCALYPEDYEISRHELIEHLIGEKVIESMKSRQEELDKGHTLLNTLENACLLEGGSREFRIRNIFEEKRRFVKMHDLIRDMALQIAGAKFLVSEYVPNEEEWKNDVEKVSLMCKRGSKFPNVSPKCPKLSTLLLRGYVNIIPDSFFVHLHGLTVLHVDCPKFKSLQSLPNSVSDLKHLTSLRLNIFDIRRVPSLAELIALTSLDLSLRSLEEIPHGLEMLVNLRYLNVDSFIGNQKKMPPGILPKLCQLQVLKLPFFGLEVNGEEMVRLKKLECFEGEFDGVKGFNTYVESLEEGGPSHYIYVMSKTEPASELGVAELGESVILRDWNICLPPKDVHTLLFSGHRLIGKAWDYWKKAVWFKECEEIEYLDSYFYTFSLQSLEILHLVELKNLKGLFREENVAPAAVVPLGTFSHLKQFSISHCGNIKKLFPPGLLLNLEQIKVYVCNQLEEIIGGAEASNEVEEIVKIFPRLRNLTLRYLPKLKTICSSSNVILCDSLNSIDIHRCPMLKRLPLSLHRIDGKQSSPPSSLQIKIEKERWELLEWDDHGMKMVLEPLCHF